MLHMGYYGAASFSRARLTGVPTEAFAVNVNRDSGKGYYSVFYVLASSPYHELQELKGKKPGPRRRQLHLRLRGAALYAEQDGHRA